MPTGCAALACSSVWKKDCDYSFHRFPLDAERRKKWLCQLNRKNYTPSRHTFLCSKHFEDFWFDRTGQTIRLRENAVPTIFSFPKNTRKKVAVPQDTITKKTTSVSESKLETESNDIQTENSHCEDHDVSISCCAGNKDSSALSTCTSTDVLASKPASISDGKPDTDSPIGAAANLQTILHRCEDHTYYLQSLSAAKRKIEVLERRLEAANKKIKLCQQSERRVNTKCTKLKNLVDDLKKRNLGVSEESAMQVIEKKLDGVSLGIFRNEMSNHSKDPHGHRYSDSLIEFCLTLYSYSPQAYEYVRQHLAIPHPHTLRKWNDTSDGDPLCKPESNSHSPE
ncbi:THAP domain-containing protein 1-like isoform X1 [Lissotriton helveticus]